MQVQTSSKLEQAAVSRLKTQSEAPYVPSDPWIRQQQIKGQVRKGNVENILPMIALKARNTMKNIPAHVQVWLTLDDLIAQGIAHASTTVLTAHSSKGPAGYVTYLWKSLDNLYIDVLKALYSEKRFVRGLYSMDSPTSVRTVHGQEYDVLLSNILEKRPDRYAANEARIIQRIDSERAFLRLYTKASPRLRRYLIAWILQPTEPKFKLYGSKFYSARKEFRQLAVESLLGTETCRFIWKDGECRKNICRSLCRMIRTAKTTTQAIKADFQPIPLKDSLEALVVPVALTN